MSYIKSNFDVFAKEVRDYTADEVAEMTTEQFDKLPLSDQISIFHKHRDAYNRLTGKCIENTTPQTEDTRTEGEKFADEFESRWQAYMDAIKAHNA